MLNRTGIRRNNIYSTDQILFHTDGAHAVGVLVDPTIGSIVEHGKTLIKAGTPIYGDILDRDASVFSAAGTELQGVLLHDIDVTDMTEPVNATLLIAGFVNLNRLDDETRALITATVKETLDGKVQFLTD